MGSPLEDLVFAVAKREGIPTAPLGSGWELTFPAGDGRSQAVAFQIYSFEGEPFVRFTTRVGARERISSGRLEKALELNCRLPHGCLGIDAGFLVMTESLSLAAATPEQAASVARFLAHQADLYERVLFDQDQH